MICPVPNIMQIDPIDRKISVETDYLPYINFNVIVCAVCDCHAKQSTKSATFKYK